VRGLLLSQFSPASSGTCLHGEIASPLPAEKINVARNKVIEIAPIADREIQFVIASSCAQIRDARFTVY